MRDELPEIYNFFISFFEALHMMNRSVTGGGPMSQQPGALENVKYMTTRLQCILYGRIPDQQVTVSVVWKYT